VFAAFIKEYNASVGPSLIRHKVNQPLLATSSPLDRTQRLEAEQAALRSRIEASANC
jgi:hypothetical protein